MRQQFAEAESSDPVLPQRFKDPRAVTAIAAGLLPETHFWIESFAGDAVLHERAMLGVLVIEIHVVGVLALFPEAGCLGTASEAGDGGALTDPQRAIETPRPVPVIRAGKTARRRPIDEHDAEARAVAELLVQACGGEVVACHRAALIGLHVEHANVQPADASAQSSAADNRYQVPVLIKADAPREEQVDLVAHPHVEQT